MVRNRLPYVSVFILSLTATLWAAQLDVGPGQPYATIQSAVDAAVNGDTVTVQPGTYREFVYFRGKDITVTSANPLDRSVVSQTIITGAGLFIPVMFEGTETAACTFAGFTITNGRSTRGAGVHGAGTRATIAHCIVTNNNAVGGPGGGLFDCDGIIRACTITHNTAIRGAAITSCDGIIADCLIAENVGQNFGGLYNCAADVVNCTIVNNTGPDGGAFLNCSGHIVNCIVWANSVPEFSPASSTISYSCFAHASGPTNTPLDPGFVDYAGGDFRLLPSSPCIDAGTSSVPGGLAGADLDGRPRRLDGDSDGVQNVDMGAYEAPPGPDPALALSIAQLYAEALQDGPNPPDRTMTLVNTGGAPLEWTLQETYPWLSIRPMAGTVAAGGQAVLTVAFDVASLSPGDYLCQFEIASNAANIVPPVGVYLHVEGPVIALSADRLDFFAAPGGSSPPQTLAITNSGGGAFDWSIEMKQPCSWLHVSPSLGHVGDDGDDVLLQVDPAGMTSGDYLCPLTITAPDARNSPASVLVRLHVGQVLRVPSQYPSIGAAIAASEPTDTIIIAPGTYREQVDLGGRTITLRSTDPADPAVVTQTVIDAQRKGSTVTFSGSEPPTCRIDGLTITGGYAAQRGGGINGNGTQATVSRCIIRDNSAEATGAAIYNVAGQITGCIIRSNYTLASGAIALCSGRIINCLITGNQAVGPGVGAVVHNCDGQIINCTIADNSGSLGLFDCGGSIANCIVSGHAAEFALKASVNPLNSCFPGGGNNGNISADPRFIAPGHYRLSPQSPCIDGGHNDPPGGLPAADLDNRPRVLDGNGDLQAVVDMGAYEYDPDVPYFTLSAANLRFTAQAGVPLHQKHVFTVLNTGGGTLNWAITENCDWLIVAPSTGASQKEANEIAVIVDAPPMTSGVYTSTLTLSDPRASNTPVHLGVELCVLAEGVLPVPDVYPTIQSAVDAAQPGQTVLLRDGVYTGAQNRRIALNGKAVAIRSENGPDRCIVDCLGLDCAFFFDSQETPNSVIEGLTVTNGRYIHYGQGYLPDWLRGKYAAAAVIMIGGSPTFVNCTFLRNSSLNLPWGGIDGDGGAVYCAQSRPNFRRCRFIANSALRGAAAYCTMAARPTFENCIFSGNRASREGGALYIDSVSSAALVNCTLVRNVANKYTGGGIYAVGGSLSLTNCILWGNTGEYFADENDQLVCTQNVNAVLLYNCIAGWTGRLGGVGNFDQEPLFVDPGRWSDPATPYNPDDDVWIQGDYHLMSEGWRWDSQAQRWVYDKATSPCVDAGSPGASTREEPTTVAIDPENIWGRNRRINMGAYGGTPHASMPPHDWTLTADINNDMTVETEDLVLLATCWLHAGCAPHSLCQATDISRDNRVTLEDLSVLASQWGLRARRPVPVAHWKLDGDFSDSAGRLHAAPAGNPLFPGPTFARVGTGAVWLDGIDDCVRIVGYKGVSGPASRTISVWIKTTDTNGAVIGWGAVGAGARYLLVTQEDGRCRLEVGAGYIPGNTFICDNRWHHVAAVLNNGGMPTIRNVKLYVDGIRQTENASSTQAVDTAGGPNACDVTIGVWPPDTTRYFNGMIDDVRIYDRALAPQEIADLAK